MNFVDIAVETALFNPLVIFIDLIFQIMFEKKTGI